ncbi:type II secretion system F family protein [Arenibacter sp. M-2]|uniref:type II secretion system F family protein n=1 Tax=Arenibacter sp. M-2 TaxID=3053612 RepID=UPI00256FF61D|nr:type II secretion system F family protein [Arenibacter sp. M-2]MDL5514847.1 type II secretion system F family protein [Arenibacter sp. M-2]
MGFKLDNIHSSTQLDTNEDRISKILQTEIILFGKVFSNKKKEDFYVELSVLLKAGINLKDSLSLLAENQKNGRLKDYYDEMVHSLVSGKSFFEILQSRKEFTEYEFYSVKIGEETGNLSKIIEELGKFYAGKNEQRRSLINALTYPLIILITAVLVVIFMLRMVVPMFEDIFKQNNVDLPAITKMVVAASNFIKDYGWLVLLLIAILMVLRKSFSKKVWYKRPMDFLLLKLPYVGSFVSAVYLAQFTQAVALLTSSKVPMLNSIQLVNKMIDFHPLNEALSNIEKEVLSGNSLHGSMAGNNIFDNKMISLVRVAEETNQTEYIFERLNQQYATAVRQKSKMLSTLMEPLIIIIVGIFVGIILISMYLPMFRLSTVIG